MSSLPVTAIKYPYFEDATPIRSSSQSSSQAKYSSDNFRIPYDLIENIRNENTENAVIEIFKKDKSLSSRQFKIITHEGDENPIMMTFCHLACKKNAKKVLDWFVLEFPGLSIFENPPNLNSPLHYVIENLPDNESNSCIVSKLAKGYYDIRKECINSSEFGHPILLNKEKIDALKRQPNIFLTDRIFHNGINESLIHFNVFFRALINGKHLMYETMLGTYVEKEEVTKIIADCSPMQRDLISIVYDYALFVITPKVQDILSLTILGRGDDFRAFYNPLTVVIIHLFGSNDLDRKIQLIKTAKLLLNYNKNLAKFPSEIRFLSSPPFTSNFDGNPKFFFLSQSFSSIPNLINRIENDDANTLATEFMNLNGENRLSTIIKHIRMTHSFIIKSTDK